MGKEDLKLQLQYLREKHDRETMVNFRGLRISRKAAKEYQSLFCGACGKMKSNPKPWYGEFFCGECVERFKAGK